MSITRRVFLRNGALAIVGTSVIPSFLSRAAFAQTPAALGKKRMIVLFQRGAADGLNIVIPHAEPLYYRMRPTIAIPEQQVIDLDGYFGLHPSMSAFKPLWDAKHLAVVHAAGSPDNTRSHFDAQDYMESGTPGVKGTEDGWLNRALEKSKNESSSPFRAVALGTSLPRTLAGHAPAIAISNVRDFGVGRSGSGPSAQTAAGGFESMYAQSVDAVLHGTGNETFDAVKMLKSADPDRYTSAPGADYPRGKFADSLRQLAQLLKAELGVQVAFADIGGWDHHSNEGPQLNNVLREFGTSLAAFATDMGDRMEDIVLVTMSEFGRTAEENGNAGTDHGHGSFMMVIGGQVQGGKVYGKWPGLEKEQLFEGRDLAVTTDYRAVLSELVSGHLGQKDLNTVFPGFQFGEPLGLLRA